MAIKIRGTHIESTHPLSGSFHKWIELMEDPTWLGNDCPWWYNERASISQFAGALWLTGGWVFEEFSATKRIAKDISYKGRVDLMFWTTRARGGPQFVAEVKPCWPRLRSSNAIADIQFAFNEATKDVQMARSYGGGYTKLAMIFAAPVIPSKYSNQIFDKVNSLLISLRSSEPNAQFAWYFRVTGDMPRHKDYLYPGVILGVRKLGY